jgi:hypothetical protein
MLRHKVADYAKWRPVFDQDVERQEQAGLTGPVVYRAADDDNDIFIRWEMKDRKLAEEFAASTELQEKMKRAGVLQAPDVLFVELP